MKIFSVLISSLLIINCNPHINPSYFPLKGTFDKEGHRGCRGLMPENTIAAYLKAVDLGVTTLEMDAVITKDKQVIMSHEPFFNHEITTKKDGSFVKEEEEKSLNIYQMTYDEVTTFDVGTKPHPRFSQQQKLPAKKPLLKDVIDSMENYAKQTGKQPLQYNIETKCTPATDGLFHPAPDEFVELIMDAIRTKRVQERVIIQSFDIRSLQYVHQHYSSVKTSLLIAEDNKKTFALQLKDLGFIPTIYSPAYKLVTSLLIKQCHDAGIRLIPWTVNDKTEIDRLRKLGVDGIISDYPNLFSADQ